MVTPGNVLVPPIWHFILLHHPLPSAFPSPHTGITLIMIIAVMIMITTAKLHSLSHIQHPGDYDWLKGCLRMFPSPRFFRLSSISLCFFPTLFFFLIYLAFSYFPRALSTRRSLPLQLTSCLSSVFFNFLAVFHLCCCAPFNLSWSILAPPLVPGSLLARSWFSDPAFVLCLPPSTCLLSCPLILLPQIRHDTFAFKPYCIQEIIMELPRLLTLSSGQHEMVSNSPSSFLDVAAFLCVSCSFSSWTVQHLNPCVLLTWLCHLHDVKSLNRPVLPARRWSQIRPTRNYRGLGRRWSPFKAFWGVFFCTTSSTSVQLYPHKITHNDEL